MNTVTTKHVVRLADVTAEWDAAVMTAGPDGYPVVLSEEPVPPGSPSDARLRYRIHYLDHDAWKAIDLEDTSEGWSLIQPLPPAEWLVAYGRADSDSDQNGHVYSNEGRLLRTLHLGDGIADIQTTADGRIWVSYFDEGIFGDTKLGRKALVCLDRHGYILTSWAEMRTADLRGMADCYALNVASYRDVWLYYYTDFPLVHIRDNAVVDIYRGIPIAGSHAFAVCNAHVLFAGKYGHDFEGEYRRNKGLYYVRLSDMKTVDLEPHDPNGNSIAFSRAFGRDSLLYLSTSSDLYVLDLRSLIGTESA